LKKEIIEFGFIMNKCDPYVTNKQMKARQLTVLWHVDDRGLMHKRVMDVNYMSKGIFVVAMIPFIDDIEEDLPEAIKG
jgi:hypothetical protein